MGMSSFLKSISPSAVKGSFGEKKVSFSLKWALDSNYHLFNDVLLPTEKGTTQVDHILVSIYGVFVIETKNMTGWIFGSKNQKTWTQVIYKKKFSFSNPLKQNHLHLLTLMKLLNLDENQMHSLIVFVGDCVFKTQMPLNVTYGRQASRFVKSHNNQVISHEKVSKIIKTINGNRLEKTLKNRIKHIDQFK
ncbi:MAG: Uncharacterised protein [Cellvibrionales bacterium UBA7375]|nr:MAG: Uncharacterised protein [Cellvibrionales bacterium UBA7375]